MARTKNGGNGRLEDAMAVLSQAQTNLVQTQAAFLAQLAETNRYVAELDRINSERFRRIETILLEHSRSFAEHSRTLAEHTRILEALTEAVREKIGFRAPSPPA